MSERRCSGNWFALLGLLVALASACGGTVPGGGNLSAEADPEVTLATQETTTTPAWKAGTNYAVGAVVTYNGITYECRQAHRSIVGWEPPRALSLWQRPTPAGLAPWTTQTHYLPGSEVTFAGQTWVCRREHVSQIDWLPGKTPSLWALPNRPPVITILAPAPSSQHLPTAGVVLLASSKIPTARRPSPAPSTGPATWTGRCARVCNAPVRPCAWAPT